MIEHKRHARPHFMNFNIGTDDDRIDNWLIILISVRDGKGEA